ncbi:MAG TPA: hypothetical protein VEC36_00985, partial [Patescibacteria group bacterium]|nr:hypothetical protein [Patescibacteria group bacterium]
MKRIIVVVLVILTGVSQSFSLSPTTVPNTPIDTHVGRLSFTPLIANPLEGRVGAMYQFADNKLRLDIGNSIDVYKLPNRDVAFGVDFYTFTRLRSEGNFKFPVETSDYYFGVNFSSSSLRDSKKYYDEESDRTYEVGFKPSLRLRLAHISSHLVDGLADTSGKLEKKPFVYSREFADLVF